MFELDETHAGKEEIFKIDQNIKKSSKIYFKS